MLDGQYIDARSDLIKLDGRINAHMSECMYQLFLGDPLQCLLRFVNCVCV
jgi:hypothetical protein